MILIQSTQPFSFNYVAFDQNATLNVAFNVYDVTSGTAVFVTRIIAAYSGFGAYMAGFTGGQGKTYLVIGVVYTDNTFTTVNTDRPPTADVWQISTGRVTYFGFAYATYDQNGALNLQANVNDMTTGTPVFLTNAAMTYVAFGVYFGHYLGTLGKTYQIEAVVYTAPNFLIVDTDYSISCQEFESLMFSSPGIIGAGILVGQTLGAELTGQNLNATLLEA